MSRLVVALFSESFPARFPHAWRRAWRSHLLYWMDGLLTFFLFVVPWFAVPHWLDPVELPKALLALSAMSVWLVLRGVYVFLGAYEEGGQSAPTSTAFSIWMAVVGALCVVSWLTTSHTVSAFLGGGSQASTSCAVVATAFWVTGAVFEAARRLPQKGRRLLRAWFAGSGVGLAGSLLVGVMAGPQADASLFSVQRRFDTWLILPVVWIVGLALLSTRGIVPAPLTFKKLARYRLGHAVLALVLISGLLAGLIVDLGWLWFLVLGASLCGVLALVLTKQRHPLAWLTACLGIGVSVFGLVSVYGAVQAPALILNARESLGITQVSELLPDQALSWNIAGQALSRQPFFGTGPASWMYTFDQLRPLALNQTPVWNVRFAQPASALIRSLVEYGGLPVGVGLMVLVLLMGRAIKVAYETRDPSFIWPTAGVLMVLGYGALRPANTSLLFSGALLVGILSSQVFLSSKKPHSWFEESVGRMTWAVVCLIVALGSAALVMQRAAAAELFLSKEPIALPLARRLNPADDVTYAKEALISLDQAEALLQNGRALDAVAWLDRADGAVTEARKRNGREANHVALALRAAQLRLQLDPQAGDHVLEMASELDRLRPTDPSAPLARFDVYRTRAAFASQEREGEAKRMAEEALQESLRRKPDFLPALYARAAWLAQTGDTSQAIQTLEQLAVQHKDQANLLVPLALLYRRNNEPLKAAALFEALAERAPETHEYLWQQSLALLQAERWNEATAVLQSLIAAEPQNAQYRQQLQEVLKRRARFLPATSSSSTSTP